MKYLKCKQLGQGVQEFILTVTNFGEHLVILGLRLTTTKGFNLSIYSVFQGFS